jgi:hypothetical protein
MYDRFAISGDADFDAVRPLDHVPEAGAIVMELRSDPTLRDLLLRSTRPRPRSHGLVATFGRAGAWLREYHAGVETAGNEARRADAASLADAVTRYGIYLAEHTRQPRRLRELAAEGHDRVAAALTGPIPLAGGHGDFAPRNIFVDAAGRVAVIDAHPRWPVPIYEDIARFIVNVRLMGAQIVSRDLALSPRLLDAGERAFLRGYFGDSPPERAVKAYELLILLDRWAAWLERDRQAAVLSGRRAAGLLMDSYFLAHAERTLRSIARTNPRP